MSLTCRTQEYISTIGKLLTCKYLVLKSYMNDKNLGKFDSENLKNI